MLGALQEHGLLSWARESKQNKTDDDDPGRALHYMPGTGASKSHAVTDLILATELLTHSVLQTRKPRRRVQEVVHGDGFCRIHTRGSGSEPVTQHRASCVYTERLADRRARRTSRCQH